MRKLNVFTIILLAIIMIILCTACASSPTDQTPGIDYPESSGPVIDIPGSDSDSSYVPIKPEEENNVGILENPIISAAENDNINFSLDINTANYALFKNLVLDRSAYQYDRKYLAQYVQIDQMLNYFDYDYSAPQDGVPFAITASVFDTPFNPDTKLMTIGLSSKEVKLKDVNNNIVILLDVSGSMSGETKLELAKTSILKMIENFSSEDKISLVTYANKSTTVFSGLSLTDYDSIAAMLDQLQAYGSTNGEGGLTLAYEVAQDNFIEGGNNRIILMSDGDFNVGIRNNDELYEFISEKRESGVYLSCVGFGDRYDYSVATMETLAKNGNGNWGYIHNEYDADKLLVDDLASTLVTVAKDVKANIQFNKDIVKSYRLLGYENNILGDEDYEDDTKDAGEIGSNFTITICFEISLNENIDLSANSENIAQVNLKYKDPQASAQDPSSELALPVVSSSYHQYMSETDLFVSSVVEFALVAINSRYKADSSLDNVMSRLSDLDLSSDEYKTEFVRVVREYYALFPDEA